MRAKAKRLQVDLLLVDTGDLHDGAGLSDATELNGEENNQLFEKIDYDVLTPGNHELYLSEITYEHFNKFSKRYGDRYVTSNVKVYNPATSEFEYMGVTRRYFTTEQGLRIMAFGVMFNMTLNSNASQVIPAQEMVQEEWFLDVLNSTDPVDLYLVIGHNPVTPKHPVSTLSVVHQAIRAKKPDTPIQIFGGHNHIRDFVVYDDQTTAMSSGRYCETLGWLSMSGIKSDTYHGPANPIGVPNPTQAAVNVGRYSGRILKPFHKAPGMLYSRRYIDWNRLTFEYHATGSQRRAYESRPQLDIEAGMGSRISHEIHDMRERLNLTKQYGCAPMSWCISCAPFLSNNSIYSLLQDALSTVVINPSRAANARIMLQHTGSVRFDLPKGPFTYDDTFIVSPFDNTFQYLPDVPYELASQVIGRLNNNKKFIGKRSSSSDPKEHTPTLHSNFDLLNPALPSLGETCPDTPVFQHPTTQKRSLGRTTLVQNPHPHPGYVTHDDFGSTGDDTIHTPIPKYDIPKYFAANGSFPLNGKGIPELVDLVFLDFIGIDVLEILIGDLGATEYGMEDVGEYLPGNWTTNSYLKAYARGEDRWQRGVGDCPVGLGFRFGDDEE